LPGDRPVNSVKALRKRIRIQQTIQDREDYSDSCADKDYTKGDHNWRQNIIFIALRFGAKYCAARDRSVPEADRLPVATFDSQPFMMVIELHFGI